MRVATYNILKGGSQRVHWKKLIQDHFVDLLLLQETFPHGEHLPLDRFPNAEIQSVWKCAENYRWGSAIHSTSGVVRCIDVNGFTGWVVGAEISGAVWQEGLCDSILVFSIHVPSRNETYAKQVDKLLDEIARVALGRQIVIGGDFNIAVSHWPGSERKVSKKELAIQARLAEEFGLINCWQEANPDRPLAQTLRWTGNRAIPYHCDGLFVPKAWKTRLQSCHVLDGDEWTRLSDHNPVVATF